MAEQTFFEGTVKPIAILSYEESSRNNMPVITANGSLVLSPGRVYSNVDSYGSQSCLINVRFVLSGSAVSGGVLDDFYAKFTSKAGVVGYEILGGSGFSPNIREWQSGDPTAQVSWDIYAAQLMRSGTSPFYSFGGFYIETSSFTIAMPGNIRVTFDAPSSFLYPAHLGTCRYDPVTGIVTLKTYPNDEYIAPTQYEHLALYRWRSSSGNYVYTESARPTSGTDIYPQPFQHIAWSIPESHPDFSISKTASVTNETLQSGYVVGHHFTSTGGVTYYRDFFQKTLQTIAPPVAS